MTSREEPVGWVARLHGRRAGGVLLTLLAVALLEGLARTVLDDRLPLLGVGYALVLATVVFSALAGGPGSALASGSLAALYAPFYYQKLDALFPRLGDQLLLGGSVGVFTLGLGVLVARMKGQADARHQETLRTEREHSAALAAKNEALARANAALAEANEALESFSYVVSHDLKEPVRALNAFSRALEEDHGAQLSGEAKELAHRNVETSARLSRLIGGLLDYSRVSRVAPCDLQPVRVEESLASAECVARYEHLLQERAARLVVTPGPAVMASPPVLAQVLGNLVLNALRHNPNAKPVVRVSSATWREDPAFVEVLVEDNGPGFPPSVLTRFAQLKDDRPSTVRGGFGLLISRHAVDKLGGAMGLGASPELGGAAVRFTLPAAGGLATGRAGQETARKAERSTGAPKA